MITIEIWTAANGFENEIEIENSISALNELMTNLKKEYHAEPTYSNYAIFLD